jgi:formate-dependent nitrite reductase cytochrome c552 subunit
LVENSCKTCHLATREFGGGPGGAAVVGHEFIPKPEACVGCHGPITSFDDIPALEDFDGDGMVEGVQSEVQGLMHLLEDALIASGLDTTGGGFAHVLGDTLLSTYQQREAGYNLVFLEDDKSKGVHNPDYAVQLLQQSILYIGGTLPSNATIVRDKNQVVANW